MRVAAAVLAVTSAVVLGFPGVARADTVADYQKWYYDALRIKRAHKITKGAGVIVAVIDSGVYAAHPDLRGQVLPGVGLTEDSAEDGRTDPDDEKGHGTSMAGIIAGRGGGELHVLGIAPKSRILPVAVGNGGHQADVAEGIRWAVDHGADVINISLAGTDANGLMRSAVEYALAENVVIVAGAGNREQGHLTVQAPANIPGVIAVTGTGKSGTAWSGSATGPEAVVSAPAARIASTMPPGVTENGYGLNTGTSDATAIVSGVVALVRARYPKLSAANVVNRLIRTADDKGTKGRDEEYGYGAVDPVGALTAKVPFVLANPLVEQASASPGPEPAPTTGDADFGQVSATEPRTALLTGGLGLAALILALGMILYVLRRPRSRRRPAVPAQRAYSGIEDRHHPAAWQGYPSREPMGREDNW